MNETKVSPCRYGCGSILIDCVFLFMNQPKQYYYYNGFIKTLDCFFLPSSLGCMNGWTQFENKCYLFSRQVESWIEASVSVLQDC